MRKTAFKKFEGIWSASADHIPSNVVKGVVDKFTWFILEYSVPNIHIDILKCQTRVNSFHEYLKASIYIQDIYFLELMKKKFREHLSSRTFIFANQRKTNGILKI